MIFPITSSAAFAISWAVTSLMGAATELAFLDYVVRVVRTVMRFFGLRAFLFMMSDSIDFRDLVFFQFLGMTRVLDLHYVEVALEVRDQQFHKRSCLS